MLTEKILTSTKDSLVVEPVGQPYISFVVGARNDSYGGDFLNRMQTFLDSLLWGIDKYGLSAELVIVEWNPPADRLPLLEALDWSTDLQPDVVRIIEVPPGIHNSLANSSEMPFFEFVAKNAGIRRARGEFILVTNADIILSDELMCFLASEQLSPNEFYRVDRHDVACAIPPGISITDRVKFCRKNTSSVQKLDGVVDTRESTFVQVGKRVITAAKAARHGQLRRNRSEAERLHTRASGDFFLMSREHWHGLRGYPELSTHSYIDGYICFMASSAGLHQRIVKKPACVFHQEHHRTEAQDRPWTDYAQYLEQGKAMLEQGYPTIFNGENWGLGDIDLPIFDCARISKKSERTL